MGTPEENKALVRRLREEVGNRRNFAILNELVAPDFVDHDAPPDLPTSVGPAGG